MNLPFSRADFLDVFARYNTALWPVALILWWVSLAQFVSLFRGGPKHRAVSGLLTLHWAWAGIVYHAVFFARINPAARLFAVLFVLQAVLLARGLARGWLRFGWERSPRHFAGAGLCAYALLYPLLAMNPAHFAAAPTFGVPCPTTLLTAGWMLMAVPPLPRSLVVIPVLWSLVGGSAAFLLGMTPDLMLLAAGALLAFFALVPHRSGKAEAV